MLPSRGDLVQVCKPFPLTTSSWARTINRIHKNGTICSVVFVLQGNKVIVRDPITGHPIDVPADMIKVVYAQ